MKQAYFFILSLLAITAVIYSCSPGEEIDDPTPGATDFPLLKSNQWKVVAKHSIAKLEGALGGGYGTTALATQKPNELRWYSLHFSGPSTSEHTEIVVNTQGDVVINKELKGPAYGGALKGFVGSDVWKVNGTGEPNRIHVFKNDQLVDQDLYPEGRTNIKRLIGTEDGFLNISESMTSNYATHYQYATQRWKNNTFFGNNFTALRYNGKTYVLAFTRNTSADGFTILQETDNRVVVQDPQIPSIKTVHYPMATIKSVPGTYGTLVHASVYKDDVFLVFINHTSNTKYGVVKVNLSNLTVQLIQNPETGKSFGIDNAAILYNASNIEADNMGNLYVVESRNQNNNAYYSIRKYGADGKNEVILKEEDLEFNTRINGLKFFNGKLYVALVNKQQIPDSNPDDFSFSIKYYLELVTLK